MRRRFQFSPVKPKARPRAMPCRVCGAKPTVTADPGYRQWKDGEAQSLALQNRDADGPAKTWPKDVYLGARINITRHGAEVEIFEIPGSDHAGRKSVKGDIDNLEGAIYDALQDAGVFANDRQIVYAEVMIT